jgi:hypothetical protein
MRVALLLSGQLRNGQELLLNLYESIIKKYSADIFIAYNYDVDVEANIDTFNKLYNPKEISFNKYPQFNFNWSNKAPETDAQSVFKQWYGIYQAERLKANYEQENGFTYDAVIRARFDLEYENELEINFDNDIWIPIGWNHRGGINDTFAYGNAVSMYYYAQLYPNLQQYLNEGALLHPEFLLKYHLDKLPYGIMRTHYPIKLRDMQLDKLDYRQK